jgi:hypothetical protein
MGDDEMRQQLTQLRVSVDNLTETVGLVQAEVKDIRDEQRRSSESHKQLHAETRTLHEEHLALVDNLRRQEKIVEVHLRDYERQAETNELIHAHLTGATLAVREELKEFRTDFKGHAEAEERDRRDVIKGQRDTIRWIVGTGIVLMLGIVGMAIQL